MTSTTKLSGYSSIKSSIITTPSDCDKALTVDCEVFWECVACNVVGIDSPHSTF